MAEVFKLFQGNTTVAIAVELENGEWAACGGPYWRNESNISAYFYVQDDQPCMELSFLYARLRPDKYAHASLRLGSCKSIDCARGLPYGHKGLDVSCPKLKFWNEAIGIFLPEPEHCRHKSVTYVALSLEGAPALKWKMVDMDSMQPGTGSESVRKSLGAGGGRKIEILFAYAERDQYSRPNLNNIPYFVDTCRTIGKAKAEAKAAASEEAVVDLEGENDTPAEIGKPSSPQQTKDIPNSAPESEAFSVELEPPTAERKRRVSRGALRTPRAGGWAGDGRGSIHPQDPKMLPQNIDMLAPKPSIHPKDLKRKKESIQEPTEKELKSSKKNDSKASFIDLTDSEDPTEPVRCEPLTIEQARRRVDVRAKQMKTATEMEKVLHSGLKKPGTDFELFDRAMERVKELQKEMEKHDQELANLQSKHNEIAEDAPAAL